MSQKQVGLEDFIDARPVTAFQMGVLALCGLVVFLDGFDTQVIGYIAPMIAKEMHVPKSELGLIFSSGLVGLMAGFMVIAPLADRFGRRPVILLSTVFFGLFSVLTTTADTSFHLIILRFLTGLGLGGAMPNALALTGEYCPKRRRATLVIIMFCGYSLGSIVAGLLSAQLLSSVGWRGVLWIGGTAPLIVAAALFFLLPESPNVLALHGKQAKLRSILARMAPKDVSDDQDFVLVEQKTKGLPVTQILSPARLIGTLLLWTVFFMNLLDLYFLQSWLPTLFTEAGMSLQKAIAASTLIMAGGIVAAAVTGPLMDKLGPYIILAALFIGGAISVTMIGLTPTSAFAMVMVSTFCAGFCISGAQKSCNALAVTFYPTAIRATGVGWALGVGRLGSIVGPLAAAALLTLGLASAKLFFFAAIPLLIAAVAVLVMGKVYGMGGRRAEAQAVPVAGE